MQLSKPTRHQSQSQFGGVGYIQGKLRIKQRISDKPLMHNSLCFFPELKEERRERDTERENRQCMSPCNLLLPGFQTLRSSVRAPIDLCFIPSLSSASIGCDLSLKNDGKYHVVLALHLPQNLLHQAHIHNSLSTSLYISLSISLYLSL